MTHKGRRVEHGSMKLDGFTHFWIEIAGVTVWRRAVPEELIQEAKREQERFLKNLKEEEQE